MYHITDRKGRERPNEYRPSLSLGVRFSFLLGHGLTQEDIEYWHNLPSPSEITDRFFFSELTWVIYNAGMKEALIRSKWPAIEWAYFGFEPIVVFTYRERSISLALSVINHLGKANAVADGAAKILEDGPMNTKLPQMSEADILEYFETFPYIGRVTRYHLARNIGYDVVKPDRHLVRLAEALDYPGFDGPDALVQEVSLLVGERKGYVDYIFWRWLSIEGSQKDTFGYLPRVLRNWGRERGA